MSDYLEFASALRKLLASDRRRREFEDDATSEAARERLGIPEEMALELRNVLRDLARPAAAGGRDEAAADEMRTRTMSSIDGAQEFLDNSFRQLRTAFRISLVMSVSLFGMGMVFLGIAAYRALAVPGGVGTTAVVAGVGVVQIVALFYRNPLRDVGRAVSNAQQSKMAIMSYMLGVSLVGESVYHGKPTEDAGRRLRGLTRDAIELLERYSEDRAADETREPPGSDT